VSDILIRGVDSKILSRLKARAKRNGRSLQGEAKLILENAAGNLTLKEALDVAAKWRKKWKAEGKIFSDSTEIIRELREGRD